MKKSLSKGFISGNALFATLIFSVSCFIPLKYYFPTITGQYEVGTNEFHWIDENRQESYSPNSNAKRELMVRFWYPSFAKKESFGMRYFQGSIDIMKDFITYQLKISESVLRSIERIYIQSRADRLINDKEKYPVIIFSHGNGGLSTLYTAQCEELASHGYVVVGINHTYMAKVTRFPDGREILNKSIKATTYKEREGQRNKELEIRVADVKFVINRLEELNSEKINSIWFGKLDLKHIGIVGHSSGGATAILACMNEKRISAGINMDSPLHGPNVMKGFDKPFMNMLAEQSMANIPKPAKDEELSKLGFASKEEEIASREKYEFEKFIKNLGKGSMNIILAGAAHGTFCDFVLLKDFFYALKFSDLGTGTIDGFRANKIITSLMLAFFDQYLKDKSLELLNNILKEYSEIT